MSYYLKNKFKNNKEMIAAFIASITSLAVAVILGYANLASTEKQIANQLDIQKNQIIHQNELLKEQIIKERNESEERNKREIDRINLMQKNSIELLNEQIVKESNLFNERKIKENQEEVKRAANYITSDILVQIASLKGIALLQDTTDAWTSDAYLLPIVINQINTMKYEIFSTKEIPPPTTYIEKLPIYEMTECLKFYNKHSLFAKWLSNVKGITKDLRNTFSSQTNQEFEGLKLFLKKNDDEMFQWLRNYEVAILKSIESSAEEMAVYTIESGINSIDILNKITNNKTTYDFDHKELRKQVQKKNQLAQNELSNYIQLFNLSYPQWKDKIINSDEKKTNINFQ